MLLRQSGTILAARSLAKPLSHKQRLSLSQASDMRMPANGGGVRASVCSKLAAASRAATVGHHSAPHYTCSLLILASCPATERASVNESCSLNLCKLACACQCTQIPPSCTILLQCQSVCNLMLSPGQIVTSAACEAPSLSRAHVYTLSLAPAIRILWLPHTL